MKSPYDIFADVYSRHWTLDVPEKFYGIMQNLFLRDIRKNGKILDMCCGTGDICKLLSEDGFDVTGVDNSKAMLQFAKENVKGGCFVHSDVLAFHRKETYDAIICMFDSVNHFTDNRDMLQVFENAYFNLKDNGVIFFDANEESAYDSDDDKDLTFVEDDVVSIVSFSYNKLNKIARYEVTVFNPIDEKCWERNSSVVFERAYSKETIHDLLLQGGFKNIQIIDGEEDLRDSSLAGRYFVKAWK